MKNFLSKNWIKIIGIVVGTLGGYLYYHFIGCVSGTCPITSNPYNMMVYGAVLGYLLFDLVSSGHKNVNMKRANEVSENNDDIDKYK